MPHESAEMKILTPQQVDQYAGEGATHPLRAFAAKCVDHYDHYDYSDHEPRPLFDFDPEVDAFRQDATARYYAARDEQVRLKSRVASASAAK